MKKKIDLATKLHYELNLDNFFNIEITENQLRIMGWYTLELEKILFDKGYQVECSKEDEKYRYIDAEIKIVLFEKPF